MSEASYHHDETREAASTWLAKADRGLRQDEQIRFEDWLRQDPRHREAWEEMMECWEGLDQVHLIPELVEDYERIQSPKARDPSSPSDLGNRIS